MNFRRSARWWLYRPKDLIRLWQIHNFCESLSCDWSFFSSICKWNTVYSAGENSVLPLLQKTQTCNHHRRCQMSWPVWVQACHILETLGKAWGSCHIMSPNNSGQSARADEKDRDQDSRWALHRRKTNLHRGFQASMFNADHQITKFCVFTQHSTVGWHNVPWLHTASIFCGAELLPHRYWTHSSKTMVKGKVIPVYTMKTFRGSTVTTAFICNLSRK